VAFFAAEQFRVGEVEGTDALETREAVAFAVFALQAGGQGVHEPLSIVGSLVALLLFFDDLATDEPVGDDLGGVDGARDPRAGGFENFADAGVERARGAGHGEQGKMIRRKRGAKTTTPLPPAPR
jgi:hypothetical protein